jgi:hypothetical protein
MNDLLGKLESGATQMNPDTFSGLARAIYFGLPMSDTGWIDPNPGSARRAVRVQ